MSRPGRDSIEGQVDTRFMWYVYILECRGGVLYTGTTTDVPRRFLEHQQKTARYTSYNPPIRIVHTERFRLRSRACAREAAIKHLPRRKKLALIDGALTGLTRR